MKRMIQSILARSKRTPAENDESPRELLPPRRLQEYVGGAYKEVGAAFFGYLVELCGLQRGDAVLDVGCGSGRRAVPLTGYLNREGRYAGFDISKDAIAWCKANISPTHRNFDFEVADIENKYYNPKGIQVVGFPLSVSGCVVRCRISYLSVHAHVANYIHEIVRVLKPGGRCLSTFFLLNEESLCLIEAEERNPNFEHKSQSYRTIDAKRPEAAIAYREVFVRDLQKKLPEPLHYGSWCGRTDYLSFQDVVIAVKPARLASEVG